MSRAWSREVRDAVTKSFGLRIREVKAGSEAAKTGIEMGDVLVAINHIRVRSFREYAAAKKSAVGQFTVTILRGFQILEFAVKKS